MSENTTGSALQMIDLTNAQGMSALQLATDYFYGDLVMLLLRNGAAYSMSEDFWRVFRFVRRLVYHWRFLLLARFFFALMRKLFFRRYSTKLKSD